MPLQISEAITPGGLHHLRIDLSGHIGIEDGRALEAWVLPGSTHHRGYMLSRVAKGTEYSPEVRRFFSAMSDKCRTVAVVLTSPLVRAAINLMVRYSGDQRVNLRMFTSEAEALDWLDSQARSISPTP